MVSNIFFFILNSFGIWFISLLILVICIFDFTLLSLNEEIILLSIGIIVIWVLISLLLKSLRLFLIERNFNIYSFFYESFILVRCMQLCKVKFLNFVIYNLNVFVRFELKFLILVLTQFILYEVAFKQFLKAYFFNYLSYFFSNKFIINLISYHLKIYQLGLSTYIANNIRLFVNTCYGLSFDSQISNKINSNSVKTQSISDLLLYSYIVNYYYCK